MNNTPDNTYRFLSFFKPANAGRTHPPSRSAVETWSAPRPKANELVLKRRSALRVHTASLSPGFPPESSSVPFPAPVQLGAAGVPRPVAFQPASPWAHAAPKPGALVLRRAESVRAKIEFTRPSFPADRPPANPLGNLIRSC